jgi:hypothetical protein
MASFQLETPFYLTHPLAKPNGEIGNTYRILWGNSNAELRYDRVQLWITPLNDGHQTLEVMWPQYLSVQSINIQWRFLNILCCMFPIWQARKPVPAASALILKHWSVRHLSRFLGQTIGPRQGHKVISNLRTTTTATHAFRTRTADKAVWPLSHGANYQFIDNSALLGQDGLYSSREHNL